jgi:hypothetical protein
LVCPGIAHCRVQIHTYEVDRGTPELLRLLLRDRARRERPKVPEKALVKIFTKSKYFFEILTGDVLV